MTEQKSGVAQTHATPQFTSDLRGQIFAMSYKSRPSANHFKCQVNKSTAKQCKTPTVTGTQDFHEFHEIREKQLHFDAFHTDSTPHFGKPPLHFYPLPPRGAYGLILSLTISPPSTAIPKMSTYCTVGRPKKFSLAFTYTFRR